MSYVPKNIQVMANRLQAFTKNTLTIQPQTKTVYNPQDTISFRLPQNALLDLHTCTLKFLVTYSNLTNTPGSPLDAHDVIIARPRWNQFFRRVDVTMGSTAVGMTGCSDYGAVATLLGYNCMTVAKDKYDLAWHEGGDEIPFDYIYSPTQPGPIVDLSVLKDSSRYKITHPYINAAGATAIGSSRTALPNTRVDSCMVRSFLGVLGGQYFRLLDTNLLPDVIVSFQLGQKEICPSSAPGSTSWTISDASLRFETLSFGDGVYRALIDRRLSAGPITYPFVNYYSFEGAQTSDSSLNTQFTVASKSVNGVIATLRPGNYDRNIPAGNELGGPSSNHIRYNLVRTQATTPNSDYYQFSCGKDAGAWWDSDKVTETQLPTNTPGLMEFPRYPKPYVDAAGQLLFTPSFWGGGQKSPKYSFMVDSKLYPQFIADVTDCSMLAKNFFDGGQWNLNYNTVVPNFKQWLQYAFMFAIGLDHHTNVAENDNLVSGLDTRNSQIPITLSITNLPGGVTAFNQNPSLASVRPFIVVNMTSMLVVGGGRVISTVQ